MSQLYSKDEIIMLRLAQNFSIKSFFIVFLKQGGKKKEEENSETITILFQVLEAAQAVCYNLNY